MACCGKGGGAAVQYLARANDGTQKLVDSDASARLYLAQHGGGTVKAVPKKVS